MEIGLFGAGLLCSAGVAIWTALTQSANGDLRVKNHTLKTSLKGERESHITTLDALSTERTAHDATVRQLVATETLVVNLAERMQRFSDGGDIGDLGIAGGLLDRLLANKDSDRADPDIAPEVLDAEGTKPE